MLCEVVFCTLKSCQGYRFTPAYVQRGRRKGTNSNDLCYHGLANRICLDSSVSRILLFFGHVSLCRRTPRGDLGHEPS
eukprot:1155361-Pelagomonas_calceolata.AAC.2